MCAQSFDHEEHLRAFVAKLGGGPDAVPTANLIPVEPNDDAISLHLDLKDWVALSKVRVGRPDGEPFRESYEFIQDRVANGSLRVVLSAPLYTEIALRVGSPRQRTHLADVMSEISRFWTLNSRPLLLESEIEQALSRRLGRPAFPNQVEKFGRGIFFAFKGERHGVRLDDDGIGVVGRLLAADPVGLLISLHHSNELMEWGLLRGPGGSIPEQEPDQGLSLIRKMDEDRVSHDREFAQMLRDDPKYKSRLDRAVLLRELYTELGPEFENVLRKANMSIESFVWRGTDWVLDFLNDLPVIRVQSTLRAKNHANATRTWSENDLRDFEQLSIAVPYCDIVVTERHSAEILRVKGIDAEFGTEILRNVRDIPDAVGRIEHVRAAKEG